MFEKFKEYQEEEVVALGKQKLRKRGAKQLRKLDDLIDKFASTRVRRSSA